MGMYSTLHFYASLKIDTPDEIIETLDYMLGHTHDQPNPPFDAGNWFFMLQGESAYLPGSHLTESQGGTPYGGGRGYDLAVNSSLKNYDNEIVKFLDWIMPYVDYGQGKDNDFLGYWMYESDEEPTLIYKKEEESNA